MNYTMIPKLQNALNYHKDKFFKTGKVDAKEVARLENLLIEEYKE